MSAKLTHEEAYRLRLFVEDPEMLENHAKARRFYIHGRTIEAEEAERLLAEYDREWVVVRRADVEDVLWLSTSGDCGHMLRQVAENFRAALEGKQ